MTAGSCIIQDEIERAAIAVLSANGTFAALGARVTSLDDWTASAERDEAYPPAVVVECEPFSNDGGAAGWPLYIGNMTIRALTVRTDDMDMSACKQIAQAVLETVNGATWKTDMATELIGTGITYHGMTGDPSADPLDEDNWNQLAWTFAVRCQQ